MNLKSSLPLVTLICASLAPASSRADVPLEGQHDLSFGSEGVASVSVNLVDPPHQQSAGVARTSNGLLYLASTVNLLANGQQRRRVALARFDARGHLDSGFGGGDGLVFPATAADVGFDLRAHGIVARADGKLLVNATRYDQYDPFSEPKLSICRYNVAGNLDSGFAGDGCANQEIGVTENAAEQAAVIRPAADDAVLLAGFLQDNANQPDSYSGFVYKLRADGSTDPGYGAGAGFVLVKPPGLDKAFISDLRVLADGSQLVFGSNAAQQVSFVAKLTPVGDLDGSFGVGGHALFSFANLHQLNEPSEHAAGGAIDALGRIYFCGYVRHDFGYYSTVMAVARLDAGGQLDAGFSGDGRLLRPFIDVFPTSTVESCELDSQQRLVLGVQTGTTEPNSDYGVMRLLPDGEPDPTFNLAGQNRAALDLGGGGVGHDAQVGLVLDADDGVIVAGTSFQANGYTPLSKQTMVRFGSELLLRDSFE